MTGWLSNAPGPGESVIHCGTRELARIPQATPFADAVKAAARSAELVQFSVFVDGREILAPEDAPATFEGVNIVEVRAYQKAGWTV